MFLVEKSTWVCGPKRGEVHFGALRDCQWPVLQGTTFKDTQSYMRTVQRTGKTYVFFDLFLAFCDGASFFFCVKLSSNIGRCHLKGHLILAVKLQDQDGLKQLLEGALPPILPATVKDRGQMQMVLVEAWRTGRGILDESVLNHVFFMVLKRRWTTTSKTESRVFSRSPPSSPAWKRSPRTLGPRIPRR